MMKNATTHASIGALQRVENAGNSSSSDCVSVVFVGPRLQSPVFSVF